MNKKITSLLCEKNHFFVLRCAQCIFLLLLTIYNFYLYNTPKIATGNSAARVLLAIGVPFGIGRPYQDLFEYAPPGILIAISSWVEVFSASTISFRALHATLIFITGVCLAAIVHKVARFWLTEAVVFFPMTLLLFSLSLQSDVFSIELFGTAFALLGLVALLYIRHPVTRLAFGSGLLFAASQIKETYTFCALPILYSYVHVLRKKSFCQILQTFLASLYGPIAVVALIVSYILLHDALKGYIYVLSTKLGLVKTYTTDELTKNLQQVIQFFSRSYLRYPNIFAQVMSISLLFISGEIMQKVRKGERLIQSAHEHFFSVFATVLFSVGIFTGFMVYGQVSPGTRMIPIGVAMYLLLATFLAYPIRYIADKISQPMLKFLVELLILICAIFLFLPTTPVLRDFHYNVTSPPDYDFFVENKIQAGTSTDDCILHLYGWEVPQTFIYTRRRPCTRFFLANLVASRPDRIQIYQEEVLANPPAAILYNTLGTDLNIAGFEESVIHFSDVIEQCYVVDTEVQNYEYYFFAPGMLYWKQKGLGQAQLRECYREYGLPK